MAGARDQRAAMTAIFVRWLINTIAIMLAIKFIPGMSFTGQWWGILMVGVIFGLVNTFIRPLIKLFTLPFLILTLGLFTLIINALMLIITSWVSEQFGLGFSVSGFQAAFWGGLTVSIVSMALSCLLPPESEQRRNF